MAKKPREERQDSTDFRNALRYSDPYENDAAALLAATVAGRGLPPGIDLSV
ncbi:hypothetical protein ABZY81_29480 [Streptomyces sp. NPDC006514]|uniref:hypothetical protein n=1 Tax=Streptomyces sp. NPDC006514 TaxID=3154308 RepID=UPI0033B623DF